MRSADYLNDQVYISVDLLFPDGMGIFQDANSRIFGAQLVRGWIREQQTLFSDIARPPHSLDLSSVENLWHVLEKTLFRGPTLTSPIQDVDGWK